MAIKKPYRYIYRQNINKSSTDKYEYVRDAKYASNRVNLSRAYTNIERKLREILDYIEPSEKNKNVYSVELYSLLLRACTEVELNLKQIMQSNGENGNNDSFNMNKYIWVEQSSRLSEYELKFLNWRVDQKRGKGNIKQYIVRYEDKILCPFKEFGIRNKSKNANSRSGTPEWYRSYNKVKHNRETNFRVATLDNCMNAVAGILVLLYSEFGPYCIDTYTKTGVQLIEAGNDYEPIFDADVMFEIYKKPEWKNEEKYDFNWAELKNDPNPFDTFHFCKQTGGNINDNAC